MTDNCKGANLLHYGINYDCKKFYDTGPWPDEDPTLGENA